MTQVANLNTGMTVPAKGDTSFLKHDQSQLELEEFASIMNQNAQNYFYASSDSEIHIGKATDSVFSVSDTTDAPQKSYEKLTTGNRTIDQAKTASDTENKAVFSESVRDLADDVKTTVQESMSVTEEDIERAMEILGLDAIDLLQPQNLIQLVQELTGSADVSNLLTNEDFQLTLQNVNALITDFQQEYGLSEVQFSDLLEQLSMEIDKLEEAVRELLNVGEDAQELQFADSENEELLESVRDSVEEPEEISQNENVFSSVLERRGITGQDVTARPERMAEQESEQTLIRDERVNADPLGQTQEEETGTAPQKDQGKQQSQASVTERFETVNEQHAAIFHENSMAVNESVIQPGGNVPQMQSYVQLEQLMDQMEGLARAFASTEGTTLEMQLNPENLGRLVLTVTEKHGNVTAQIAATNEQVKEALQTQLVELRATLQAQGIKVEAVEVTVATHEFEQNLDGNASANSQMQEQSDGQAAGEQGGRRNLDMNHLDELSGLMSEEETLVAQMMRDNGGTVDYTA